MTRLWITNLVSRPVDPLLGCTFGGNLDWRRFLGFCRRRHHGDHGYWIVRLKTVRIVAKLVYGICLHAMEVWLYRENVYEWSKWEIVENAIVMNDWWWFQPQSYVGTYGRAMMSIFDVILVRTPFFCTKVLNLMKETTCAWPHHPLVVSFCCFDMVEVANSWRLFFRIFEIQRLSV